MVVAYAEVAPLSKLVIESTFISSFSGPSWVIVIVSAAARSCNDCVPGHGISYSSKNMKEVSKRNIKKLAGT